MSRWLTQVSPLQPEPVQGWEKEGLWPLAMCPAMPAPCRVGRQCPTVGKLHPAPTASGLFPAACKEPWSSVTKKKKKLSSPYCFNKAASTHLHQDRSVSSRRWSCSTCTCGQKEPQPHSLSSGLCLLLVGRHLNCPDSWAVKRFIACALAGLSLVSVPKSLSGAGLAVLIP